MSDSSGIICPKQAANVPAILTPTTGDTVLASNPARCGWIIQNLGTNTLFILMGASATTSLFHVVLKGSSVQDDGTGGTFVMTDGIVYTGVVSVAGTTPRLVVTSL